jgi:hypothetical protein
MVTSYIHIGYRKLKHLLIGNEVLPKFHLLASSCLRLRASKEPPEEFS